MSGLTTYMYDFFQLLKENSRSGYLKDWKREGLLTSERPLIGGDQNKHKHALCKASCNF